MFSEEESRSGSRVARVKVVRKRTRAAVRSIFGVGDLKESDGCQCEGDLVRNPTLETDLKGRLASGLTL